LRQVNISLQCLEARGPEDPAGRYLDTIFNFIAESRKTGGPFICLRLWNGPAGAHDGLNGRLLRGLEERFRPGISIEKQLASGNDATLADKIFLNRAPRFEWPGLERPDRGPSGFCLGLREQVAILVDGTVVPCCLDAEGVIKLGDIRRQSLEEIVQGPRARRLFNGFSRREAVEELCRRCGYRERFDRMRRPQAAHIDPRKHRGNPGSY
jgi:radical SAM protein with 4Fe4S-binding SPASM domain